MTTLLPATVLALAVLAGCGDSLLGELGLNEPLGLEPASGDVAWEVRWFDGDDGLVSGCDLYAPSGDAVFAPEASLGYLDMPGPDLADLTPGASLTTPDYTWSLGLALLVESASERQATADEPFGGVLGLASFTALLRVEGDWDRFVEDLDVFILDDELVALSTEFGLTWVELDAYRAADGSFESALIVSEDPTAQISGLEGVVPVDSLDIVDPVIQPVWRGEPLGGLTLKDCE